MITFRLFYGSGGSQGIECYLCGRTSYNPDDIEKKFCASCGVFHEDEARQREDNVYYQRTIDRLIYAMQSVPPEQIAEVLKSLIFEINHVAKLAADGSDEVTWFSKLFPDG